MTDLVERLRAPAGWECGLYDEAADEIERLRIELKNWMDIAERNYQENARSSLELARAKAGLEEIYKKDTVVTDGGKCHDLGPCAEIVTATLCSIDGDQT